MYFVAVIMFNKIFVIYKLAHIYQVFILVYSVPFKILYLVNIFKIHTTPPVNIYWIHIFMQH